MLTLFGAWRNMVARLLWEQEVAGSNPVAPTINPSSDGRPSGSVRVYDDRSLRSLGHRDFFVPCFSMFLLRFFVFKLLLNSLKKLATSPICFQIET
jgi:hypothetical protein